MVKIKSHIPPVSISSQLKVLDKYYPDGQIASHTHTTLSWIMDIVPTPNSASYRIKVDYAIGGSPKVYVISPKVLAKAEGKTSLPHVYSQSEQQLCLFMPGFGEWEPYKFIAKTIIPWTAEWLAFYEIWLFTGVWEGEGLHPQVIAPEKKRA